MSSNAAKAENLKHDRSAPAGGLDELFSWGEVQSHNGTMSIDEAAALLGIDLETAESMIAQDSLCAKRDKKTGAWLVETACVKAQLVDGRHADTESGDELRHQGVDVEASLPQPDTDLTWDETSFKLPSSGFSEELVDAEMHAMHASFAMGGWEGVVKFPDKKPLCQLKPNLAEVALLKLPGSEVLDLSGLDIVLPSPQVAPAGETKVFDRAGVTAKNVEALMDSLDFANVRLEGAMYRIGFLEGQVASLEEQLKVLPEFRSRAARAIMTERENVLLQEQVEKLFEKTAGYEMLIDTLDSDIVALEQQVAASNGIIDRLKTIWWFQFCCWLFGLKIS